MDNKDKTPLEEANVHFEEIKKFAINEAKKEVQKELDEKINKIVNESLESLSVNYDSASDQVTITTNYDSASDQVTITTTPEEGEATTTEINSETGEVVAQDAEPETSEDEIEVEEEPIEIVNDMENIKEETQEQIPAETPAEAPVDKKALMDNLAKALAGVLNPQDYGAAAIEKTGGGETAQDVAFINDEEPTTEVPAETPVAPVETPATPAETPAVPGEAPIEPEKPVAEDAILEFDLENIKDEHGEGEEVFEVDLEEEPIFEIEIEEEKPTEPVEEMKGVSKTLRNTSNRLGKEPREGTPNLQESEIKIKAQYESKLGELNKENASLKESVEKFNNTIKDYNNSFAELRTQFDEMQTFNAKLAYANKIFASGGFSIDEKTKIAEEFDKAPNADDAKKIYERIIKEHDLKVTKNDVTKLKSSPTHSLQSKQPLFESEEMKKMQRLAGIEEKNK